MIVKPRKIRRVIDRTCNGTTEMKYFVQEISRSTQTLSFEMDVRFKWWDSMKFKGIKRSAKQLYINFPVGKIKYYKVTR
jgi:hypothetical protein